MPGCCWGEGNFETIPFLVGLEQTAAARFQPFQATGHIHLYQQRCKTRTRSQHVWVFIVSMPERCKFCLQLVDCKSESSRTVGPTQWFAKWQSDSSVFLELARSRQLAGSRGDAQKSAGSQESRTADFQHFSVLLLTSSPRTIARLFRKLNLALGRHSDCSWNLQDQGNWQEAEEMHRKVLEVRTFLCISWLPPGGQSPDCSGNLTLLSEDIPIVPGSCKIKATGRKPRRCTEKCWKSELFCASPDFLPEDNRQIVPET